MSNSFKNIIQRVAHDFKTDNMMPLWSLYQRAEICYHLCVEQQLIFNKVVGLSDHSVMAFDGNDIIGLFVQSGDATWAILLRIDSDSTSLRIYRAYDDDIEYGEDPRASEDKLIEFEYADIPWVSYPARPSKEYFLERYQWDGPHNCSAIFELTINLAKGKERIQVLNNQYSLNMSIKRIDFEELARSQLLETLKEFILSQSS